MSKCFLRTLLTMGLLGFCSATQAQWTTQTIVLQPGWNAVFLEVQPEPRDCDTVFSGLAVESVWSWTRRFTTVQYIQDTNNFLPKQPDWLGYYPTANPLPTTLLAVDGGKPYLIKLTGSSPVTWNVTGKALVRNPNWLADSLNLVGFTLPNGVTTSYQNFFAGSSAHANSPIYTLNSSGIWQSTSSTNAMQPGRCFWIYCKGWSDYFGPANLTMPQYVGLDYGRNLVEQTLRLKNTTATTKAFTLTQRSSLPAPAGQDLVAGDVPLQYWTYDPVLFSKWLPFPATLTIPPGQEFPLRIAVVRTNMTPFNPPPGVTNATYQSILEITDGSAIRIAIPVMAKSIQGYGSGASSRAGLWIGTVSLNAVNQPASVTTPSNTVPTGSDFQFKIILHVDQSGTARLLQKVVQMWKPGTYKTDPTDPTKQVVDTPGRYVLLADDSLIPKFSGAALRDGQPVGRRFSSAAFSFKDPIPMAASGDFGAGAFSCAITNDYDSPLNPFKHKFHPDHDNLDPFQQKLSNGLESYTVTRFIALQFASSDPQNLGLAGWGDTQLGGLYSETITGLHSQRLYVQGVFRLQQASRVALLNDRQ